MATILSLFLIGGGDTLIFRTGIFTAMAGVSSYVYGKLSVLKNKKGIDTEQQNNDNGNNSNS